MVVFFPAPASFTGEDCGEFHIHGSVAVIKSLIQALCVFNKVRLAQAGEFSRRALENGKLNLTEIEGLADLIAAETQAQHQQSLQQLEGHTGDLCQKWRQELIECRAFYEAILDFSDEEDVPADLEKQAFERIEALEKEITHHINTIKRGEQIRNGFVVAITGPPNAGKSTLLNLLARRDVALVSEIAGTTRDFLEITCDISGYPVVFIDTAGLRETSDPLESMGIQRALKRLKSADLILWLSPVDAPAKPEAHITVGLSAPIITVLSKADLIDHNDFLLKKPSPTSLENTSLVNQKEILFSAHTEEGLDALFNFIKEHFSLKSTHEAAFFTQERHRLALQGVLDALKNVQSFGETAHIELIAEELRQATHKIGVIMGLISTEDVLDVIFSQFCIGK
jgi:tRNA modification GTPase